MKCPACHHNNPNDAVFCMKCGKKLQKECIHCGAELPENALFCIKCGKKLTSSGLLVVMCSSPEFAQSALDEIRGWVSENGLTLHPDKTHIGDCMVPGKGFDFLGYRFEAGKRWVRKKSMKALRGRIRNKTRRTCGNSLQQIIRRSESHADWMVWLLQACEPLYFQIGGWVYSPPIASHLTETAKEAWNGSMPCG
jgi:ribosomal protein L40E